MLGIEKKPFKILESPEIEKRKLFLNHWKHRENKRRKNFENIYLRDFFLSKKLSMFRNLKKKKNTD